MCSFQETHTQGSGQTHTNGQQCCRQTSQPPVTDTDCLWVWSGGFCQGVKAPCTSDDWQKSYKSWNSDSQKPHCFPHWMVVTSGHCKGVVSCVRSMNVLTAGSCIASHSHHCWHPWFLHSVNMAAAFPSPLNVCVWILSFHYPTEEIILASLSGANQQAHTQTKPPQCVWDGWCSVRISQRSQVWLCCQRNQGNQPKSDVRWRLNTI